MNKRKTISGIFIISFIGILAMYIMDSIINPGYIYKSLFKLTVFALLPILYTIIDKNIILKDIFKVKSKTQLIYSLFLGFVIYGIILGAYLVLKDFIDLNNIKDILDKNLNVDKGNFVQVALYISFINSFLEEFFFRGFIFLNLKDIINKKSAYIISAFAFAIYHVAIMTNWFNPALFGLAMAGLFVGGLIFNYLNDKNSNIYSSWLAHMMANFAINTVGFIMYGII